MEDLREPDMNIERNRRKLHCDRLSYKENILEKLTQKESIPRRTLMMTS